MSLSIFYPTRKVGLSRSAAVALALLGLAVFGASDLAASDRASPFPNPRPRTWSDSTGKYRVKATYLGYQDGQVRLRKANGAEIQTPLEKLSASDQSYVRYQLRRKTLAAIPKRARQKTSQRRKTKRQPAGAGAMYGVNWRTSENAISTAAKQNKPILWFRVLGNLTGFM